MWRADCHASKVCKQLKCHNQKPNPVLRYYILGPTWITRWLYLAYRLAAVRDLVSGKQLMTVLLKLFSYCVKVKSNRQQLIRTEMNTISIMLGALNLVRTFTLQPARHNYRQVSKNDYNSTVRHSQIRDTNSDCHIVTMNSFSKYTIS